MDISYSFVLFSVTEYPGRIPDSSELSLAFLTASLTLENVPLST